MGALDDLPSDFCICLGLHDALFCHLAAAPLVFGMVLAPGTAVSVIFFSRFSLSRLCIFRPGPGPVQHGAVRGSAG